MHHQNQGLKNPVLNKDKHSSIYRNNCLGKKKLLSIFKDQIAKLNEGKETRRKLYSMSIHY